MGLLQPTLMYFALLPSMAWGRKQHLDLIKKLPSPTKTQEQPLLFGFQPLLLGFSFIGGWRRQLQLRGCCCSEGKQDAPGAHGDGIYPGSLKMSPEGRVSLLESWQCLNWF